jgi:CRP-like cAMP-binding protein
MLNLQSDLHGNDLLGALPSLEWRAVASDLDLVELRAGELLCDSGMRIRHVYFPATAVITLLQTMEDGNWSEVAAIGREGTTGVPVLTGGDTIPARVQVQSAGSAYRMSADALRKHFSRSDILRRITLLYMQALLTQVAQTAACSRHHSVTQQLCRWLLIQSDRTRSDAMRLMLGVRREAISEAAGKLCDAALIHQSRGRVKILDRAALEAHSCECYGIVKREFDRILPQVRQHTAVV